MNPSTRNRMALLVLLVALMASGIVYRLYVLQFVRSPQLHARAEDQHRQESRIEGRRGSILDTHGRELAVSIECGSLYARPCRIEDPGRAAAVLSGILGTGRNRLSKILAGDDRFVYLRRGLEPEDLERIEATGLLDCEDDSFGVEMEGRRFYPGGRLASHVVGFAGIDQDGISGIEHSRHEQLQGDPASILEVRDGLGRGFVKQVVPPDKPHRDVVLSLDLVLQHIAERELDRAIRETGASAASAVMIDPRNGRVLALANRPAPDLNEYTKSRYNQQRNRAGIDLYEPGSTFKIVTAAAVLDRGAVRPSTRFECENGRYRILNRTYTDHEPFDRLSFTEIIEHSSNIGMIKIAHHLPGEVLLDYVRKFGFGEVTGIGLREQDGRLPNMNVSPLITQSSLSIGYGIGVTAIQMASAFATVANHGVLVPPRIVLGTRTGDGEWVPEPEPEARRVISGNAAAALTRMLEGVVLHGTGEKAGVEGYRVAGKTGTARKYIENVGYTTKYYYASFGGFAPSGDPRLVLLVVLDSPRGSVYYGGQTAAPVFARILRDSLIALRIPPENSSLVFRGELTAGRTDTGRSPVTNRPAASGRVPDVSGLCLREAVNRLTAGGYRVRITGRGEPVSQSPAPGTRLAAGKTCTLRLSRSREGRRS